MQFCKLLGPKDKMFIKNNHKLNLNHKLSLDQVYIVMGVFIDLQKAFNCISYWELLFERLQDIGFRCVALKWMKKYFENGILLLRFWT